MMKKRILSVALVFVLLFSVSASALDLSAGGACSMDFDTGEVYYSKNGNMQMTPASLTKIMTLYIVFEKMEEGAFTESTMVPISGNAAYLSRTGDASNIPLTAGKSLSVGTLIDAMVIVSACASCTAIAEYISGSEAEFANLMNDTAAKLGIEAYFTDSSGLSNYNLISPIGMAKLVREFITKYPRILDYTKKKSEKINGSTYSSTNKLIRANGSHYYIGADGFKTGTTSRAGNCLAATAKRGDTRIITVSMKSNGDWARYTDAKKLLDEGFYRAEYLGAHVFSTDIVTYINGYEIPCYYALGRRQALCITAENLKNYGFDTSYDADTQTLYVTQNREKQFTPISEAKVTPGLPLHKTFDQPDLKVVLVKDGQNIPLNIAISLNGLCCISVDELGSHYTKTWDDATRVVQLYTVE